MSKKMPNLETASEAELLAELAKLQAELARRKKQAAEPPLPLATPDFSALVQTVSDMVADKAKEKSGEIEEFSEDWDNWCFEAALEAVYGKSIWDWWNRE